MSGRALRPAPLVLAALVAALAACASTPEPDPRHRPTTGVLEVVAVLQRHVADDTYRFAPAHDFTGRNVYRASLLRLENLEEVHEGALRAGTLDDVIAFAKGRALERLRAYDLAAQHYRKAAERDGALRKEALGSAALNDALAEAKALLEEAMAPAEGLLPEEEGAPSGEWGETDETTADVATGPSEAGEEPLGDPEVAEREEEAHAPELPSLPPEARIERFAAPEALLEALQPDVEGTHYAAIVREELERIDVARARFRVAMRRLVPDGDLRALAALQKLVSEHRESKNANRHLLELADLYAVLAEEYVSAHPPESLGFDPPRFEELVESAARLYEAVANQDGAPEKLEAGRRLEAFLAFTLRVDRDRFSP